jgi:hypothetical protein
MAQTDKKQAFALIRVLGGSKVVNAVPQSDQAILPALFFCGQ